MPFGVVLDTNALFPFTLRDTLLRAAAEDMFQLFWSKDILDELERVVVREGAMTEERAAHLRSVMEKYFPEAMVSGFDDLVPVMKNDADDRHVSAVAVKAGAQLIVTSNVEDFEPPPDGIEVQTPDEFLCNQLDLDPPKVIQILRDQAADLQKPPVTFEKLLDRLEKMVPEFVALVRAEVAAS